jgi:drug/metabolite transporter (DMT)-like permease
MLSLAAPITWAFAIIVFRKTGEAVPPLPLNIFKISVGLMLLTITWAITLQTGSAEATSHPSGWKAYMILIGSGITGISIADTLFLMSLNRIGAGLQAIVTTSYSPSIIAMSVLFLGERLTLVQSLGVIAILTAVLSVMTMRGPRRELDRRTLVIGTVLGVSAMLAQGVSVVMMKPLLDDSPIVWANCWRMLAGVGGLLVLLPFLPQEHRSGMRTLRKRSNWTGLVLGGLLGNYLSLLLWLGGMKYTLAPIASALNQTSTLWTFLLAALLLHEPITWKRVLGLSIGMLGVALVTFG